MSPLGWKRRSEVAELSTCETYSVCTIRTEDGHFYEAWKTRQHPDGPGCIQTGLPTADFAKRLCAEDAAK